MPKFYEYVPTKLDEGVYTFAIPTTPCPSCGLPTLDTRLSEYAIFWDQVKAAGIKRSFNYHRIGGQVVCEDCWERHRVEMFTCANCDKDYPRDEIQYEYRMDGTGYLCKTCYRTITAEQWDKAVKSVQEYHQYAD